MAQPRRLKFLLVDPRIDRVTRTCDQPGCHGEGLHRAPRSRDELDVYYWFCLDHVRAYNAQWDFFDGMSQGEIEDFRREDVTGHRPTWPMGLASQIRKLWNGHDLDEMLDLFGHANPGAGATDIGPPLAAEERDALAVMNLSRAASRADVKARFKELVKRHHPDLNGGDKTAEGRLVLIIEAYRVLLRTRPA